MPVGAYRESFRLAWPLVVSNISVPLLGMVDTAVVGRLDEPYALGGVALGANLTSAVYFAFGFLRMGTTALTAQALGSGDGREIRATAWRAFIIAAVIGLLAVLAIPLALGAGSLLFAPEPAIDAELRGYLQVRIVEFHSLSDARRAFERAPDAGMQDGRAHIYPDWGHRRTGTSSTTAHLSLGFFLAASGSRPRP